MALLSLAALSTRPALAAPTCLGLDAFNSYMVQNATTTDDVTMTFQVTGVNPADYPNGKGAIAQLRNSGCAAGQDSVVKLYGTSSPPNTAHPAGTLKQEIGNFCCSLPSCPERWAEPNASAVIFVNGSEVCDVTVWNKPAEIGYRFVCGGTTYEGKTGNPDQNIVNHASVLKLFLPGGGTTWEMPSATASNVQVCFTPKGPAAQEITVPVSEDVTASAASPQAVFADVNDLAAEAGTDEVYLKFVVPAVNGLITKTQLLMHTRTESFAGGDGALVYPVASSAWSETSLTWSNRPPHGPTAFGRLGPAAANQWVSLELPGAISKTGTYSFVLVSPSTDSNGTHFFSKEATTTEAAYLRLTYTTVDADGDGSPEGPDCDDKNPAIHPKAQETCNSLDDNCNGSVDEGCPGGPDLQIREAGVNPAGELGPLPGDLAGAIGDGAAGDGSGSMKGGCGCQTAASGGGSLGSLLLLALLALRRRRGAS